MPIQFLQQSNLVFPRFLKWLARSVLVTGIFSFLGFAIIMLVWIKTRQALHLQIGTVIFLFSAAPLGLGLLYSAILGNGSEGGFWKELSPALKFCLIHLIGLSFLTVFSGAALVLLCAVWVGPVLLIRVLSGMLGLSAYDWAFPRVFLFGLILWFPLAVAEVYIPVVLWKFYSAE